MKVLLIGDLHANLPALEAVLADEPAGKVDAIWNTGDFVGYGAFPEETIKRVRESGALSVIGNYDQKVILFKEKKAEWKKSKAPEKFQSFQWSRKRLSKENLNFLRSLPMELRFKEAGKRILVVHGSPLSIKEHLTTQTPDKRLKELAKAAKADVIICGHSHQPFVRELDGVFFTNPGSVGRPGDGDPRASYAVLKITSKTIQIQHYRVKYDLERAVAAIRVFDLPEAFAEMLIKGRDLDHLDEDSLPDAAMVPERGHDRQQCVKSALMLGASRDFEADHARQVSKLAVQLFDQLASLHRLGRNERTWLECAALLHDIGISAGTKQHHKSSLSMILEAPLPPLDDRERRIVASIARYHRKALPNPGHDHFALLASADQQAVRVLAALLRVADGLDRSHLNLVRAVSAEVSVHTVVIKCAVTAPADAEAQAAVTKSDLFEQVFNLDLVVKCSRI